MDKSVFKVFFSKEKENNWLNSLGQQGFLLESIWDSKYIFTKYEDEKFYYSIENLDCSPRSAQANEYFAEREGLGITPLLASGNWVYFVSKNTEIPCTKEICKKNSRVYFWRSLYLLFFAIWASVLCGYHIFMAGYLNIIGQAGEGCIELLSTDGNVEMLNLLKSGFNYILKAINAYFGIWTDIFGKNDAVAIVSAIIPILLIILLFAAFNLDSYICFKQKGKRVSIPESSAENSNAIEEVMTDAE